MSPSKFNLTVFATLIFFNLGRFFGWKFFSQTVFWQTIMNDNLHHYQLGILLLVLTLFLKKRKKIRDFILAIGSGMIIDESMYAFYSLSPRFSHYSIIGIGFEFLVFAIFSVIVYKLKNFKKRIYS